MNSSLESKDSVGRVSEMKFMPVRPDFLDIEELLNLLKGSKKGHYHCEDDWFCCRACRHSDHLLDDGEHLGNGWDVYKNPGDCTCEAAAWNNRIDAMLEKWK